MAHPLLRKNLTSARPERVPTEGEMVVVGTDREREGLSPGAGFAALAFRAKSATVRRSSGGFLRELMDQQVMAPEDLRACRDR